LFGRFRQRIAAIILQSKYEKTAGEKMAREVDLHPVHETDPGKLARQGDFSSTRDNGLVSYKEECSDESCSI
jgi:hypothetical protein